MFVDPNYIESDCIGWDAKFLAAPSRRQLVNQSQTMTHDILHISKDPCSFLLSFQQHFFLSHCNKAKTTTPQQVEFKLKMHPLGQ